MFRVEDGTDLYINMLICTWYSDLKGQKPRLFLMNFSPSSLLTGVSLIPRLLTNGLGMRLHCTVQWTLTSIYHVTIHSGRVHDRRRRVRKQLGCCGVWLAKWVQTCYNRYNQTLGVQFSSSKHDYVSKPCTKQKYKIPLIPSLDHSATSHGS